jgi:hypothetical protein
MYKTSPFPNFDGTTHLHERVYVTRPNDPGMWTQFSADPCIGNPCDPPRQQLCHGVDQMRYDRYRREYQTPVFCLDQLNTIEEGIAKMAAIARGYQDLPEDIASDFLRLLTLRKAGTTAQGAGIFLAGLAGAGQPGVDYATEKYVRGHRDSERGEPVAPHQSQPTGNSPPPASTWPPGRVLDQLAWNTSAISEDLAANSYPCANGWSRQVQRDGERGHAAPAAVAQPT